MYSGYLNDYTVDENNSIKSVLLEDTKRYNYDELKNTDTNRDRPIRGSLMYIACENVMNINFTHIFEPKVKKTWKERFYSIARIVFYLLYIATFLLFWLDNFVWHFSGFVQKTLFIFFSILFELLIFNGVKDFVTIKEKRFVNFFAYLLGLIFCSAPILYSLEIIPGWFSILYVVVLTIITVIASNTIIYYRKKKQ